MALMDWDNSYSVGIAAIDEQHRRWIGILNRLHDAMVAGKGRAFQEAILSEMVAYTRTHFLQEELMLKVKGYPKLAEHREKHAAFTKQVQELEAKVLSGAPVLTIDMMEILKRWLREHILSEDMQYGNYLKVA